MGIIYSHWAESLNIWMKSLVTDSHNENFWGHKFLVLLLAEFIIVNKFSFDLLIYHCPCKFVYKGYIDEIKKLCTDYH